jgi:hypothetical protein
MLGRRPVSLQFKRLFQWQNGSMELTTEIWSEGGARVKYLSVGDEFFVRYVPQSRFFQMQELETRAYHLSSDEIANINRGQRVTIRSLIGGNS